MIQKIMLAKTKTNTKRYYLERRQIAIGAQKEKMICAEQPKFSILTALVLNQKSEIIFIVRVYTGADIVRYCFTVMQTLDFWRPRSAQFIYRLYSSGCHQRRYNFSSPKAKSCHHENLNILQQIVMSIRLWSFQLRYRLIF